MTKNGAGLNGIKSLRADFTKRQTNPPPLFNRGGGSSFILLFPQPHSRFCLAALRLFRLLFASASKKNINTFVKKMSRVSNFSRHGREK